MFIVGASTLGEMVLETATALGVAVDGFVDDVRTERVWLGIPVVGNIEQFVARASHERGLSAFVAIGDNEHRARVARRLRESGVTLPNLVDPRAVLAPSARMGHANLLMALSYVGTGVVLGAGNLILPNVTLGHHNTVGNFTFVAPGVSVGGRAVIGDFAKIGMNSVAEPDAVLPNGFACAPLTRIAGPHDA